MRSLTFSLRLLTCLLLVSLTTPLFAQKSSHRLAMFRGDAQHSGIYPSKTYNHFESVHWKFKTGGKVFSTPVIVDEVAYVGSEDQYLYAINIHTGKQQWKFKTGGAVHSSPAVLDGVVYFTSYDGKCYAVDAKTGKEKWQSKPSKEQYFGSIGYWYMNPTDQFHADLFDLYLSSPVIDPKLEGGVIFYGSGDGNMYALNLETGKEKWHQSVGSGIHSSPALANGVLYFGSWDSYLYALDAKTGKKMWEPFKTTNFDDPDKYVTGIQSSPVVHNNTIYFGSRDAHFYAVDATTGKEKWNYPNGGSWIVGSPVVHQGVVYVGTSDNAVVLAIDEQTGLLKYTFDTQVYAFSSPIIAGKTLYVGNFAGKMYAVDLKSKGKEWSVFQTEASKQNSSKVDILNAQGRVDWSGFFSKQADPSLYQTNVDGMTQLYSLGSIVSSPVVNHGVIYFGSADGNLYAVKLGRKKASKSSSRIANSPEILADTTQQIVAKAALNATQPIQSMVVYPNPFETKIQVDFTVQVEGQTTVTIEGKAGTVAVLLDKYLKAGAYSVSYNGKNLLNDIYFCHIVSNGQTETRKILKQ